MGIFKDDDDKTLNNVSLPDDLNLDDVSDELSSLFKEADGKDAGKDTLDDANVDKDLLSQILSEEGSADSDLDKLLDKELSGGDAALDDDLDKLLSEIETMEPSDSKEDGKKDSSAKNDEQKKDKKNTDKKDAGNKEAGTKNNKKKETKQETKQDTKPAKEEEKKEEKKVDAIKPEDSLSSMGIGGGALTLISEGTTIKGGITSEVSIEVMGTINGDIESKGKVAINGTVTGSVAAAEIYVNTPRLEGSLSSEGTVQISADTVVVGDIVGASAYIAGAVKGSIDVHGSVSLDETAVVKGDINAKSIQINEGAVLDGHCILSYSDVNIDEVFEEKK